MADTTGVFPRETMWDQKMPPQISAADKLLILLSRFSDLTNTHNRDSLAYDRDFAYNILKTV